MADHEIPINVTITGADEAIEKLTKIRDLLDAARTQMRELAAVEEKLDVKAETDWRRKE